MPLQFQGYLFTTSVGYVVSFVDKSTNQPSFVVFQWLFFIGPKTLRRTDNVDSFGKPTVKLHFMEGSQSLFKTVSADHEKPQP